MVRAPQDPQKRINEILDVAEPLFFVKGYHETQISDIAREMGVAQGTLYYYFKSKEEVLEALIKRCIFRFVSEVEPQVCSDRIAPPHKFKLVIQTIFRTVQSKEEGLLLGSLYEDRTLHLVDKISRQAEQIIAPLMHIIIEEGIQQNYFHVIYPRAAVNVVLALVRCLIYAIYEKFPSDLIECQFKLAEELLEKTLGAQPGTIFILVNE